jgi:hypothetical protein
MQTYADKKQESQSRSPATSEKPVQDHMGVPGLEDNRPEAIQMRRLQKLADGAASMPGKLVKTSTPPDQAVQKMNIPGLALPGPLPGLALPARVAKLGVPGGWNMTSDGVKRFGGGSIGIHVIHNWNNIGQGDFKLMEKVEREANEGCLSEIGNHLGGAIEGSAGSQGDQHGAPSGIMTTEGYHVNKQLFIYWNDDAGRTAVPSSGYKIIRRVLKISPKIFNFKIIVEGATVTVGDYESKPGTGRFTAEFQLDFTSGLDRAPVITDR